MSAALDKEIRLSFAQRIKGTLPSPLQGLIPESKAKDAPDFKYNDETIPLASQGSQVAQLIRRKGTDEEILPLFQSIQEEAATLGLDPNLAWTDIYVTAICYVGSKSLSHVLSCIERCKDRLLGIAISSRPARHQIITSVMSYWEFQPGVGVNIVDKLLNYSILTPTAVIEWALVDHIERGTILAKSHIYEMIDITMIKVTNRIQQIVAAIRRPGLAEEQVATMQDTLERERLDMQRLFELIKINLAGVANGSVDEMAEAAVDGASGAEDEALVKQWGQRWTRVFQRRLLVVNSWITEELAKPIPEVVEVVDDQEVKMVDEKERDPGFDVARLNPFEEYNGSGEGISAVADGID